MRCLMWLFVLPTTAFAGDVEPRDPEHFGIGIGGGTRTSGISGKYMFHDRLSGQLVVGIDSGVNSDTDGTLAASASALVEMPTITENEDVALAWCVGAGPYLAVGGDFYIGAHAVVGLELIIKPVPIDFTIEYRPSIELTPGGDFVFADFGGHLRYWF